ncbi:MAG: HEAT repeat domain-containing protein, partial [Planctomycetota bacterium]
VHQRIEKIFLSTSFKVKKGILDFLYEIGPTNKEIPLIMTLFHCPDPELRKKAAKVIGKLGKKGLPMLSRALKSEKEMVRISALQAIGFMGKEGRALIQDMIPSLEFGSEEERRFLANLLPQFGSTVIPYLKPYLSASKKAPVLLSLQILNKLAEQHDFSPLFLLDYFSQTKHPFAKKMVISILEKLIKHNPLFLPDVFERVAQKKLSKGLLTQLTKSLSSLPIPTGEKILPYCDNPDPSLSLQALSILEKAPQLSPKIIQELVRILSKNPTPSHFEKALHILSQQGVKKASHLRKLVELLNPALGEKNTLALLEAISHSSPSLSNKSLARISNYLDSPNPKIKAKAILAISKGGENSIPYLINLTNERNPIIQRSLIQAVKRVGPKGLLILRGFYQQKAYLPLVEKVLLSFGRKGFSEWLKIPKISKAETLISLGKLVIKHPREGLLVFGKAIQDLKLGQNQKKLSLLLISLTGEKGIPFLLEGLAQKEFFSWILHIFAEQINRYKNISRKKIYVKSLILSYLRKRIHLPWFSGKDFSWKAFFSLKIPNRKYMEKLFYKILLWWGKKSDSMPSVLPSLLLEIPEIIIPLCIRFCSQKSKNLQATALSPKEIVHLRNNLVRLSIYLLSQTGEKGCPYLLESFQTEDNELKKNTLLALLQMKPIPEKGIPILGMALRDENDEIGSYAIQGLVAMGEKGFPTFLETLHESYPDRIKIRCLKGLGKMEEKGEESIPVILDLLKSPQKKVALAALEALSRIGIGRRKWLSHLERCWNSPWKEVKGIVLSIL